MAYVQLWSDGKYNTTHLGSRDRTVTSEHIHDFQSQNVPYGFRVNSTSVSYKSPYQPIDQLTVSDEDKVVPCGIPIKVKRVSIV